MFGKKQMAKKLKSDIWQLFKEINASKQEFVQSFRTHEELERWIRDKRDTDTVYLVKHIVNGQERKSKAQTTVPFVEQWNYFNCLCKNNGWTKFDFDIRREYLNARSDHPTCHKDTFDDNGRKPVDVRSFSEKSLDSQFESPFHL